MNKPIVSVMILCYNYGRVLQKALDSCAAQTFRDFELVMIDNGSTDNSKEIFEKFAQEHPEVKTQYVGVFPNQGPTHGWNEGIRHAKGEYVLFNDADDWMDANCLELLVNAAKQNDADRVMSQYREVRADGTLIRERKIPKKPSRILQGMLQGSMYRRSVILESNLLFPEGEYFIAYDAWFYEIFAVHENKPCEVVRNTAYNYYKSEISITQGMQKQIDTEKDFKVQVEPYIRRAADVVQSTADQKLQKDIEYHVIWNNYAIIARYAKLLRKEQTQTAISRIEKTLLLYFPNYRRNPLLRPFGNGYEWKTALGTWGIFIMSRLKLLGLLRMGR